jgi:SEC-C motif
LLELAIDARLAIREHYPKFAQIPVPPSGKAERAWRGTIQPFDLTSEIPGLYSDLKDDRVVSVQSGFLRRLRSDGAIDRQDLNIRYLVNMETEFNVVVLEYPDGRHPEAYAFKPEISRQRFPFHPHLRDDRSLLWGGRYLQAICTDYAPDLVCSSLLDFLDYTTIFLAKHLVWMRTRRLIDRRSDRIIILPEPGKEVLDNFELLRGPEYNIQSSPFHRRFPYPFAEWCGWNGYWPGSAAPHGYADNLRLNDSSPCPCGRGERYARCHKRIDIESQRNSVRAIYGAFEAQCPKE